MTRSRVDTFPWTPLAVIAIAYLMVVFDVSIVNVALPQIEEDLGFAHEDLQWVVSGYALALGGLLLLGGRCSDLLGHRRVFMTGLALFSVASLSCGLAQSQSMLIGARVLQGVAGAILTPSVFALVGVTFEEGRERNKALGLLGAVSGFGAGLGAVLSGVLTTYLGWRWIFFVNVPIGILALLLGRSVIRESKIERLTRGFDLTGAATVTGGLLMLVYALAQAPTAGWATPATVGLFAGSGCLLFTFVFVEARSRAPLVPLAAFRRRSLAAANLVGFGLAAAAITAFFLLSLYMQQVLGFTALETGIAYLVVTLASVSAAAFAQALATRIGVRVVLVAGVALLVCSVVTFTRVPVDGSYVTDLLPGFVMIGAALGFGFVPASIAALAGVPHHESGLAAGLFNASQQIGVAIGVAAASTISTLTAGDALAAGAKAPAALAEGLKSGFLVCLGLAAATFIATIVMPRRAPARAGDRCSPSRDVEL